MSAIFISYRRDDTEGQAGRLFDELAEHFGHDAVFMDVAALTPGHDFRRAIDEHVATCGVLLAIIGRQWLSLRDEAGGRRIDDPLDFVRLEVASALRRDIPVVPVLVQGAHMPRAAELPEDLQPLVYRNAVSVSHAMWESDVQVLVKALRGLLHAPPPQAKVPLKLPVKAGGSGWRLGGGIAALAGVVLVGGALVWPRRIAVDPQAALNTAPPAAGPVASATASAVPVGAPLPAPASPVVRAEPLPRPPVPAVAPAPVPKPAPAPVKVTVTVPTPAVAPTPAPAPAPRWRSADFPAPNAGLLSYTVTRDGHPACASYDGRSCLWGVAERDIDFTRVKPLVCGEPHRRLYGETGYENAGHWCNLALRRPRDNR
jgi:hypothetical protein